jgi:hypothetical protein
MNIEFLQQNFLIFVVLVVWELAVKGFALWKAARLNQRNWFIAILVVNSIGVLPALYMLYFSKRR